MSATKKYRETKARVIGRGKTLRQWALEMGHSVGTIYAAVSGRRNGPRSVQIRNQLEAYLNE